MTSSILDHVGNTPLVRLRRLADESAAPVLVKCEYLNPGGSLKDRIAISIVEDAERAGRLKPGDTIVEGTGGNTGVGLAMVAAVKGYRLVTVLPEKMSEEKRIALRLLGAEVVITKDCPPDEPENFNRVAERLAEEHGWFHADQFRNEANVRAHVERTVREIIRDVDGPVGAFVAGAGTGGTITGVGRVLRAESPGVRVVLADPVGSKLAGLVTTGEATPDEKYELEGMGGSRIPEVMDPSVVDDVERVTDEEAFTITRRLIREEGLLCGGSSGAVVAAALRVARRDDLVGPVVCVLADSWDRYWSKEWLVGQ